MNTLKKYFQKLKERIKPERKESEDLFLVPEFEVMPPTEEDTVIWDFIRACKEATERCEAEECEASGF